VTSSPAGPASAVLGLPDPGGDGRVLHLAHDAFVTSGKTSGVRDLVAESWLRSVAAGLDPEAAVAELRLAEDDLRAIREAHPLTAVMPVIRRLLVEEASEAGLLVAVSDAAGQLLYVEGPSALRSSAESMHFMPGADWSEASAGTNAPGTALALGRPVQILGAEHLARQVTPWSCSAAPVRDPATRAIIGVIDVTGGPDVASPYSLSLVRATAAAAEAELRVRQLLPSLEQHPTGRPTRARVHLDVLGTSTASLRHGTTTTRLTLRHSELLLLLASSRDGLTADQLGVALSAEELPSVTVRAELSRLRAQLGPIRLGSRPYRLGGPVVTDVSRVREALRQGQLRRAVASYTGPVLPASEAPAVEQLRADLHLEVRSALLSSGHVDSLLGFADTPHGHDDLEIWQHTLEVLPHRSPRRALVQERVQQLEAGLV
jgi:hypothetical protein